MDQSVRVALAGVIVTAGIAAALLFRHPSPRADSRAADAGSPLTLRGPMGAGPVAPDWVTLSRPRTRAATPQAAAPQVSPLVAATLDATEPPPLLAQSYPDTPHLSTSRWGVSMGFGLLGIEQDESLGRTHRIVDGDTLSALAQRYLGHADRALEIYRANQHLLPSPEMLPIGVELRIPLRESQLRASASTAAEAPLVPILPRGQRTP